MTQDDALNILMTGGNVFLTGEPGSGKTHTVNRYVAYLRERGVEPSITASTGIAATHIHGMTVHSWSGIGIKRTISEEDIDRIAQNERVAKRIIKAKVLIIDEVSMLDARTLDSVEAVCRGIRRSDEPFGGLQIVLVGDFFQLPPVDKREPESVPLDDGLFENRSAAGTRFAYNSRAWERANFIVCYLTEQHRQDDRNYLSILSAIRNGTFEQEHADLVATRLGVREHVSRDTPRLFSHNADVDRINAEHLLALKETSRTFTMSADGRPALIEGLKRGCLSPELLELKIGASVMFTKNDPKGEFVNGTLGTVTAFNSETTYPIVKTRMGNTITAEPMDWSVEEDGKVRARVSQVPLRLAWAMTVHKSQGMSLDAAVMDLSRVFEYGQGYVALSRVRRLAGLYLLGWSAHALAVHPEVVLKDSGFRDASEVAGDAFSNMVSSELRNMHENFIKGIGGKVKGQQQVREYDKALFSELKELRTRLARERSVPAYVIFPDESLRDMAERFPRDISEFARIRGVGAKKLEQYGGVFTEMIRGYSQNTKTNKDK